MSSNVDLKDILSENQFAVLSPDHHQQQRHQHITGRHTNKHQIRYTIRVGDERINPHSHPSPLSSTMNMTPFFYGVCHNCGYKAHSQKQCPLKRCSLCNKYGHTAIICEEYPLHRSPSPPLHPHSTVPPTSLHHPPPHSIVPPKHHLPPNPVG